MFKIISITNRHLAWQPLLNQVKAISEGGADAIVLREKDLTPEDYGVVAERTLATCHKIGTLCLLHSFPKQAFKLGATAIHLPLPVLQKLHEEERRRFTVLGASCHSMADVSTAADMGCSYVTLGHIFATDCKRGLSPRGLELLAEVCAKSPIPVYAIGGITPENVHAVRTAGAAGACFMSSLMTARNPQQLIQLLRKSAMANR